MSNRWNDFLGSMIVLAVSLSGIMLFTSIADLHKSRNWMTALATVQETRLVCRLSKRVWYRRTSHHTDEYCDDTRSMDLKRSEGFKPIASRLIELRIVYEDSNGKTVHAVLVPWYSEASNIKKLDRIYIRYPVDSPLSVELASKVGSESGSSLVFAGAGIAAAFGLFIWRQRLKATG